MDAAASAIATDPVELEILRNKMTAVAEEMGITLQRTGRTLYVKETADFGTALADRNGKFFAFPNRIGVAGFVDLDCRPTIERAGRLEPGDVIITNHPYASEGLATHAPDIHVIEPYFHEGEVVAYGWSFLHSADIGGAVPSSVSPRNTELFQEGLMIPPMKLLKAGHFNEDFLTLYHANCRTPEQNLGDIKAMLAALRVGRKRVEEAVAAYGVPRFLAAQEDLMRYAEQKARAALRLIPDGVYEFWDYLDDDIATNLPVRVRLCMTVADGVVSLDYRGTDPQTNAPFNIVTMGRRHPWLTLRLLAYVVTRDPEVPINSGVFRNLRFSAPEGSVVNARFPAAVGVRHATGVRCYDVLNGALAVAMPDFMPASPGGTIVPVVLAEPDGSGSPKVAVIQFMVGATGGRAGQDGTDGRDPSFTNMANNPIETVEAEASVRILGYGIRQDGGGPGRWRGGAGQYLTFEALRDGCKLLGRGIERMRFAPWGLAGGQPGATMRVLLNPGGPEERDLGKVDVYELRRGDVVSILMPGGGGYGDPFARDPLHVLHDVRRDLVSVEGAARTYGVVVRNGELDLAATEALRAGRTPAASRGIEGCAERAAWEAAFDDARQTQLAEKFQALPAGERARAREAFYATLTPRLGRRDTAAAASLLDILNEPEALRRRFDRLVDGLEG